MASESRVVRGESPCLDSSSLVAVEGSVVYVCVHERERTINQCNINAMYTYSQKFGFISILATCNG